MKVIKYLATAFMSFGLATAHSYELKEIDSKFLDEKDHLNYAYIDIDMNEKNLVELTKINSSGKWIIDIENGLANNSNRVQVRLLSQTEKASSIKLKQSRKWFDQNMQHKQSSFEVHGTSEELNDYLNRVRGRGKKVLFFARPTYSNSFLISLKR